MDGNGALFGILAGNTCSILHKFSVDLPKKHGRGGQSALRFARLRLEKRHNYLRKVAEMATQCFIADDRVRVNIDLFWIMMLCPRRARAANCLRSGSAEFKNKLSGSDMFDVRLNSIVVKIVYVSYGGENGFNQVPRFVDY